MKGTGKAWRWSWGHRGRPRALVGVVTDEQPCPGRVSARPLDDQAVLGANDVEPADVAAADRVVDEDGTPVHERRLHGFAQDLDDAAVSGDEPEALSATGFRNLMRLGDALVVKEAPTARRGGQLGDADVVGVLVAARAYAPRLKGQSCVSMTVTTLEAIRSRLAASGLPQHAVVRSLGISQLCGGITHHTAVGPGQSSGGWHYLSHQNLPRQPEEALVEDHLNEALIRLNPTIAAQPDRVDDVLYRLRAIIMGVRSDGLIKANEEFAAWLTGERSMPFGEHGEHVTVRLIDFEDLERNQYVVTTQFTYRAGASEKRADLVLLINGIPLVVIEAKTPVRASQSWFDAAVQIHEDYERNVPELFVPNVVSIATEGKEFRYGSIGLPVDLWGPWRIEADAETPALKRIEQAVDSMCRPRLVGEGARTRVHDDRVPSGTLGPKAHLVKHPARAGRVTKQEDHRLAVREPALGHLENLLADRARFVEHVERGRVGGMLARERFRVLLTTALRGTEPTRLERRVIHPLRGHLEPVARETQARPATNRRPRLITQLRKRVRRDGPLGLGAGGHDPVHEPGRSSGR